MTYTNSEIVDALVKDELVETMAKNLRVDKDFYEDFVQEIYMILLTYDNKKLNEIYQKDQIKYFTARVCINNWQSSTSPFWTKYKKPLEHTNRNIDLTKLSEKI